MSGELNISTAEPITTIRLNQDTTDYLETHQNNLF